MQRLEVSGAVRPIYGSLGVKRLKKGVHIIITVLLKVNTFHVSARYQSIQRAVMINSVLFYDHDSVA